VGVSIYFEESRYPDIYDTIFCFSADRFPYLGLVSQKSEFMNIPEYTLARPACKRRHRDPHHLLDLDMVVQSCIWVTDIRGAASTTFFLVASTVQSVTIDELYG
jgi:hypothetical protein